ncbi:MAG: hypothetical protein R3181_01665 [Rubricoccaceae bacterium]|nr:hypothetical protein [Rubricoccaceae bacterium]
MLPVKLRRISWGVLGIEAAAIFLSVFLAFAVSAWRESQNEEALRTQALQNFYTEILENRRAVSEAIPYHEEVYANLRRVLFAPELPFDRIEEGMQEIGWRGPNPVFLRRIAYETAEITGALGLFDFETAATVAEVYALQDALHEGQLRFQTESAYNPLSFVPENLRGTLWVALVYFESSVNGERGLLSVYDGALRTIAEALDDPAFPAPLDSTAADAVG